MELEVISLAKNILQTLGVPSVTVGVVFLYINRLVKDEKEKSEKIKLKFDTTSASIENIEKLVKDMETAFTTKVEHNDKYKKVTDDLDKLAIQLNQVTSALSLQSQQITNTSETIKDFKDLVSSELGNLKTIINNLTLFLMNSNNNKQ